MRTVVPDYAGLAEQCRKLATKMTGKGSIGENGAGLGHSRP